VTLNIGASARSEIGAPRWVVFSAVLFFVFLLKTSLHEGVHPGEHSRMVIKTKIDMRDRSRPLVPLVVQCDETFRLYVGGRDPGVSGEIQSWVGRKTIRFVGPGQTDIDLKPGRYKLVLRTESQWNRRGVVKLKGWRVTRNEDSPESHVYSPLLNLVRGLSRTRQLEPKQLEPQQTRVVAEGSEPAIIVSPEGNVTGESSICSVILDSQKDQFERVKNGTIN
jgi:hypothetical protein